MSFEKYSRCENIPLTVELSTSCWLFTFVLSERSKRTSPRRTGMPLSAYNSLLLIPLIKDLESYSDAISKSLLSLSDLLEKNIPLSQVGTLKNGYAFQSSSYDSSSEYEIVTIANVTGERNIRTEGCNRIHTIPTDLQPHQELMLCSNFRVEIA